MGLGLSIEEIAPSAGIDPGLGPREQDRVREERVAHPRDLPGRVPVRPSRP